MSFRCSDVAMFANDLNIGQGEREMALYFFSGQIKHKK